MSFKKVTTIVSAFILIFNLATGTFCSAKESIFDLGKTKIGGYKTKCFFEIESMEVPENSNCDIKISALANNKDYSLFIKDNDGKVLKSQTSEDGMSVLQHTINYTNNTFLGVLGNVKTVVGQQVCIENYDNNKLEVVASLIGNCKLNKPTPFWQKCFWFMVALDGLIFMAML